MFTSEIYKQKLNSKDPPTPLHPSPASVAYEAVSRIFFFSGFLHDLCPLLTDVVLKL